MTIQIPKDMRGFAYYRVLPADLNTIDMDHVLPSVYFKVVTGGMDRKRRLNDPTQIESYAESLVRHSDLQISLSHPGSLRLINRLLRTAIISVGKAGSTNRGDKINAINDSTLLAFKPGFPTENMAIRHVDQMVYRMLRQRFAIDELRDIFIRSLGRGIDFQIDTTSDGHYDGVSDLDTLIRLTIAYLDGMAPTPLKKSSTSEGNDILPGFAFNFAVDLERYLKAYSHLMPAQATTYYLKAILSINLYVYTVKLMDALPDLVAHPDELPPAMRNDPAVASPPLLYADFTERKSHPSWDLAVACVQRDLAALDPFIYSVLFLKQLEEYLEDLTHGPVEDFIAREADAPLEGAELLAMMLKLRANPLYDRDIEASARLQLRMIQKYRPSLRDTDTEASDQINDLEEIRNITTGATSDFERVVRLIADAQRKSIQGHVVQWLYSVGGITKPYGLLQGVLGGHGRLNWRYQPSNDLLATLVMMAGVDIPEWDDANPRPQPIRLREFLEWLERRFGIIVDRPPEMFTGPEYVAAAQDNLRAMLTRLRQMGIFRDLSDDFTVQRLIPPYANAVRHNDALEEVHA